MAPVAKEGYFGCAEDEGGWRGLGRQEDFGSGVTNRQDSICSLHKRHGFLERLVFSRGISRKTASFSSLPVDYKTLLICFGFPLYTADIKASECAILILLDTIKKSKNA